MKDQVPPEVKRARSERLIGEIGKISAEAVSLNAPIGKTLSAVLESRSGEYVAAHSDSYIEIMAEGVEDESLLGTGSKDNCRDKSGDRGSIGNLEKEFKVRGRKAR